MYNKQVKVPYEFLFNVSYLIQSIHASLGHDSTFETYIRPIEEYLAEKTAAEERRAAFTAYKLAPVGSVQREYFRERYLDEAGISQSFRTTTEKASTDL